MRPVPAAWIADTRNGQAGDAARNERALAAVRELGGVHGSRVAAAAHIDGVRTPGVPAPPPYV